MKKNSKTGAVILIALGLLCAVSAMKSCGTKRAAMQEKVDDVDKSVDNYAENVDKLRQLELELEKRRQEYVAIQQKQEKQTQQQAILEQKRQALLLEEGKLEKEVQLFQEKLVFADEKETAKQLQKLQEELDGLRKEAEARP